MLYPTLAPYGWNDRWAALFASALDDQPSPGQLVPGRVVRHDGAALLTAVPDGVRSLPLGRRVDPSPTVGDWIVVADTDLILGVLPRSSLLTRRAAHLEEPQALAANVELVLVVCGLDRPVSPGRIDRVVTLAWDAGAVPLVVLTKADLLTDVSSTGEAVAVAHPGVDVVTTSVTTGLGLDDLGERVTGRTVVVVGESGAGKSSLTNALVQDEVAATSHVRSGDRKGRHTTTARQAHPLPGNGLLIDTPGLRAVGLWVDPEAVAVTFGDVDELAEQCRFTDCEHDTEPGCGVRAALEDGTLPADRLAAWRALQREAAALRRRADPRLQRAYGRSTAQMTKDAQRRKGRR